MEMKERVEQALKRYNLDEPRMIDEEINTFYNCYEYVVEVLTQFLLEIEQPVSDKDIIEYIEIIFPFVDVSILGSEYTDMRFN